ncbi:MAG: chemotaxis protein CheW [Polyangia bacterium]
MRGGQENESLAALQESVSRGAAEPSQPEAAHADNVSMLVLRVGPRWLALPVSLVHEVVLKDYVTRVPLMPEYVLGAALLRGRVVPVISLEVMLGAVEPAELVPTLPRLVVLETPEGELAIVADEVRGIAELARDKLHDAREEGASGARPSWVTAEVAWHERLLCILDVPKLAAAALGEGVSA